MASWNVFSNYQPCSLCGVLHDDGGLLNGSFTCHDCLEKNDNKGVKDMKTICDFKGLDQAIIDFNNYNGPAVLYVNYHDNYFATETFLNDVHASQTIFADGVQGILTKDERSNNFRIGKQRKAYIIDFVKMILDGYEHWQVSYNLSSKYPNVFG